MVDDVPGGALDQVGGDGDVVVLGQGLVLAPAPLVGELGALDHVQGVQLQPVGAEVEHDVQAFPGVPAGLAGQADDQVGAHGNAQASGGQGGVPVFLETVAPVHALEAFVEGGLQAQFQPDFHAPVPVAGEQVQHRRRHAVGPGAHRQADHALHRQGLVVQGLELGHVGVGVGVGLEIGQVLARPGAPGDAAPAGSQLAVQGRGLAAVGADGR